MVAYFKDNSTRPTRALQAWIILVSRARNRQPLTYGMLAELMSYGSAHLGQILEYILRYCRVNNLPPLTVLVVNKDTGLPGSGMGDYNFAQQEQVFRYDWFAIVPPTPEELEATYKGVRE